MFRAADRAVNDLHFGVGEQDEARRKRALAVPNVLPFCSGEAHNEPSLLPDFRCNVLEPLEFADAERSPVTTVEEDKHVSFQL